MKRRRSALSGFAMCKARPSGGLGLGRTRRISDVDGQWRLIRAGICVAISIVTIALYFFICVCFLPSSTSFGGLLDLPQWQHVWPSTKPHRLFDNFPFTGKDFMRSCGWRPVESVNIFLSHFFNTCEHVVFCQTCAPASMQKHFPAVLSLEGYSKTPNCLAPPFR